MSHDLNLELKPADDIWHVQWDMLMSDPWLKKKLDRNMRVNEHLKYLYDYVPEFFDETLPAGAVCDVGCGCGELLEIARFYGRDAFGVDADSGEGGMGEEYLYASQLMVQRQDLEVIYCGGQTFFAKVNCGDYGYRDGTVALINSRGSLEQIFSDCMEGEPHHKHHLAKTMHWRLNDKIVERQLERMFTAIHRLLVAGGRFMLHCNGARNGEQVDILLDQLATKFGFKTLMSGKRLHKWER